MISWAGGMPKVPPCYGLPIFHPAVVTAPTGRTSSPRCLSVMVRCLQSLFLPINDQAGLYFEHKSLKQGIRSFPSHWRARRTDFERRLQAGRSKQHRRAGKASVWPAPPRSESRESGHQHTAGGRGGHSTVGHSGWPALCFPTSMKPETRRGKLC